VSPIKTSLLVLALSGFAAWSQTPGTAIPAQSDQNGTQTNQQPASTPSGGSSQPGSAPNAAPPATPPAGESLSFHKIDFAVMLDAYGSWNDNHPISGFNNLYNFNDKTDQVNLNMLKLTASHDPDPIGFRIDLGVGRAFDIFHTPKPSPEFFDFVEQAYVSLKPKGAKGFEADFGDFVTSAGAEVIESKDNWNYSRSLLFALAIPYYHFGVRTSMPIGSSLTVGVQVVDGWNQVVDQHGNNMKTTGITTAITRKKFTWSNNYYVGPQWTGTNNRNRNLYDTTLLLTPSDKFNAYFNYDYGMQAEFQAGHQHWNGFAGAAHWQISKRFAVSPRAEYYNDATGFTTGTRQKLHEVTVTGEYKVIDNILTRLEYRHDGSNMPYFDHGNETGMSKSQSTVTIGFIAYYPAKHQ
jgi:hypothetical protein